MREYLQVHDLQAPADGDLSGAGAVDTHNLTAEQSAQVLRHSLPWCPLYLNSFRLSCCVSPLHRYLHRCVAPLIDAGS
eukprot:COSAG06_NODE_35993_length_453_cov_0.658192_2_plen_77_part_01